MSVAEIRPAGLASGDPITASQWQTLFAPLPRPLRQPAISWPATHWFGSTNPFRKHLL